MNDTLIKKLGSTAICGFLVFLFCMVAAKPVLSQSSSQVTIVGIPAVLPSPFAEDVENNFKSGRYQVIFSYSSFNNQPVDFVFEFTVFLNNRELLSVTSLPAAFTPGTVVLSSFFEEIKFSETADEILNQVDASLTNQIIQTGFLPEGDYRIEIAARPFTGQSSISVLPGNAMFSVRYPSPPILISIPDESNISSDLPVFSWTPVVSSIGGTFEYEFLLVPVFEGQTPLQAIESNRALAQEILPGRTTLPYTPDFLPLEKGGRYAWQVTAKDPSRRIPFQNDGKSEIYSFTFDERDDSNLIADLSDIKELNLIPNFATLISLEELQVTEGTTYYEINGAAELLLEFDQIEKSISKVQVSGLRVQKGSEANPIISAGEISGEIRGIDPLMGAAKDLLVPELVRWNFGGNVNMTAGFTAPDGQVILAESELILNRSGITGTISVEADEGFAVTRVDPLRVELTELTASFPGASLSGAGSIYLMENKVCDRQNFSFTNNSFSTFIDCSPELEIEMVEGSDLLSWQLQSLSGEVSGTWNTEELDYNLLIDNGLFLQLDEDILQAERCGISGTMRLDNENGFAAENINPECSYPDPYLDLGIYKLQYTNPEITLFEFNDNGDLNFELLFDGQLFLPAGDAVAFPVIESIAITPAGIHFPDIEFDEMTLQPFTTFTIDTFELAFTRFALAEQKFPWFEWDGNGPGPLNVVFDANLKLPDSGELPACLENTTIRLSNAEVGINGISGNIMGDIINDCRWEIGSGYAIHIESAAGELSLLYQDRNLKTLSNIDISGAFELGPPFACDANSKIIPFEDTNFQIQNGNISASVEDIIPSCPVQIGPYLATITSSELEFNFTSDDNNFALLTADATLDLGIANDAMGSFTLNLLTGEFIDLNFEIEDSFQWGIPKENPVLVFEVDRAVVNESGLFIDGRQSLMIDNETMGVTFDELMVDWNSFDVISGRVIFDEAFTFEAGIDQSTSLLSYSATLRDSSLTLSPGVLLKLAGAAVIDSTGLKTSGQSQGELQFEDIEIDDLEVIFSDQFSIGLDPFGVQSGSAELYWDNQRIAIIDPSGFHPDIGFLGDEFLPERVPLPTEDVAYLEIKRDGQLLVDATNLGDGTYRIETLPTEPLKMVLPAFQGTKPAPPEVEVMLTDFIINPSTGSYISGTARATVADSGPEFDLESLGIPLTLEELIFTTQQVAQGDLSALFLNGKIKLLDHEFGDSGSATFFIQNNGRVKGTISLTQLNEKIALHPDSDRVLYELDALAGYVDIPITVAGSPDFQFDIGGRFLIQNLDDQPVASAPLQSRLTEQGFSVTGFDSSGFIQTSTLDFDFFRFTIDQISSLSLGYNSQNGFDFNAALDVEIGLLIVEGNAIEIPLKNVEISSDEGIVIPAQNIHDGSMPLMDAPAFDLGIFRLQPLAFRTEPFTLNIFDLNPGDLISLIPEMDFEVTFPAFSGASPELNQIALSIYDASFDNGIIAGTVYPYDVFGDPIFIPVGPAGIAVDLFEGRLYATDEGTQGMDIDLNGLFQMPDIFVNSEQPCSDTRVDFALSLNGGFSGRVEQFLPCGQLVLGPLSLGFGQSVLDLSFENDEQSATLSGTADAEITREGQMPVIASGSLSYDLINGSILSGSIGINEPFTWGLPTDDPLFEFTVQTAAINSSGLIFDGNGNLEVGDGSVGVLFNNLAFRLRNGKMTSGEVQIQNEFAVDIEFGPARWAVSDPSSDIGYESGVRLGFPSNITIDSAGFSSTGQSTASIRYAGGVYDNLQLNFVDMTVGLSPVSVVSGRADLMLNGERLAYYDSGGFHLDNLGGAITSAIPDTLGLPSKDIAYIILKDEQGALLVETQQPDSGTGLELSTSNPLSLVLAGLGESDTNAPIVDVSFSELVINDAFEVISGSITADVSGTPVNMDDLPIGLTAVHYKKEAGQPYKLYADARMQLPESLSELELLVEDIILGSDGFQESVFSAGTYSSTHSEGDTQPVATETFANGDFELAVRGVEMAFGQNSEFKFSGDLSSSFLSNSDGESSILHFSSEYNSGNWNFTLDAAHLNPQELPVGNAKLIFQDINIESESGFDVVIDGRLKMPEIAGDNFEIGFNGLKVGTSGVSLQSGSADGDHQIGLFGEDDNLTLNNPSLSIQNNHLQVASNGNLNILGQTFDFTGLQIGTDGTFQLGSGGGNLVDEDVNLMDEFLVLNSLDLSVQDSKVKLTAGLTATLPEPFESTDEFSLTIDHSGNVTSPGPSFSTGGQGVDLGGFANLILTDGGLSIQNIHDLNMTLFASADLVIDGKTIQFGTPGGVDNYGIRYQTTENSLEWRITDSPTFTFDAGILVMGITSLSLTDSTASSFGVSMNTTGKPKLPGIEGPGISLKNFTITTAGIGSMGEVVGGSFSLADVITFEIGQFEWGRNETIPLTEHGGYQAKPNIEKISNNHQPSSIEVDEYLKFSQAIDDGKAISITIPGGFRGEIQELFYYRNSDTFYLKIEGVIINFTSMAQLTASMEYMSMNGGDDFRLLVAGGGSIGGPLGGDAVSFAALGAMSKIEDDFRFGIFVKLQADIKIVPGILSLTQVGGGFFYNPEDSDFEHVIATTGHSFENENGGSREKPWVGRTGVSFGIALYAEATLISSVKAAKGSAILFITNQFFYVDMDATLLGMGDEFKAGMTLLVQWDPNFLVKGSAFSKMGIDPLLTSTMEMSLVIGYPEGEKEVFIWGFTANANFEILSFLTAEGDIMVSNTGFYVGVSVNGGFDIWVISVSASFDAQVWWIYGNADDPNQFGAYVEIDVSATLFKVATVGANLKGALIIDNGFLIYAEASAYVKVFLVFSGRVSIWAAIQNGKVSGGKGSKSEYTSMIDDARRNAQSIKDQMNELMAQLDEISGAIEILKMTDEELDNAGQTLISLDRQSQVSYFNGDINRFNTVPQVHEQIRDYILGSTEADWKSVEPGPELNALLADMNQKIDELKTINETVKGRFEEAYELALEWDTEALDLMDFVQNPIKKASFGALDTDKNGGDIGNIPEFDIDETIDNKNREDITAYREEVAEMEAQFKSVIDSVQTYINRVDQTLSATYTLTPASGYINPETGEVVFTGIPVIEKDQPSAKQVADKYVETTVAIDKYYGNLVSHFWETSRWAEIKFNNFDNVAATRSDVINANERILNDLWSRQGLFFEYIVGSGGNVDVKITDQQNNSVTFEYDEEELDLKNDDDYIIYDDMFTTRANLIGRKEQMYVLANGNDWQDPFWRQKTNEFEDNLDRYIIDENFNLFFGTFIRSGIEYWYEIPKRGLTQISQSTAFTADSLASDYKSKVGNVLRAHKEFSSTLDDIYRVKSSLTLTLHGIVDLYIKELETASDSIQSSDTGEDLIVNLDEKAQQMQGLKEEIENTLQPPKIVDVRVHKHLDGYNNKVNLVWSATHPTGTITEYSYMMEDDSFINSDTFTLQLGRMLSTGNKNSVTRYLFKEEEDQVNKNIQVLVRARGPSGTAISRSANFRVSVDVNEGEGSFQESQGLPEDIDEEDRSAPTRPNVEFDYVKSERSRLMIQQSDDPFGVPVFTIVEDEVYWTNVADRIEFDVYSIDPESDISGYEYALGTSVSQTDIRDYTRIQGLDIEGEVFGVEMKTNLNDWQRIRIQNVDLSEQDHYLSIRAINGDGLESNKRFVSHPIVYSGEPPVVGSFNQIEIPVLQAGQSEIHGPVYQAPAAEASNLSGKINPSMDVSWSPAVSPRAGIQGYEYVVADTEEGNTAFGQAGSIQFIDELQVRIQEGLGASYTDSFYVHMRAVDNAGNRSDSVATLGPVVVPDPTRPLTPIIRATAKPDGLGFYLQKPSYDGETGILRYEYMLENKGTMQSDDTWKSIEVADPVASGTQSGTYSTSVSAGFTALSPGKNFRDGDEIYIYVRAVNKQGISSGIAKSGPVIYDTSPPKTPTINLSKSGDIMTISISNLHDPESGVKKVEYRVCDTSNYTLNCFGTPGNWGGWSDLANYTWLRKNQFQLSKQVNISNLDYDNLKVFVRVSNRNGMQSTASYKPQPVFTFPDNSGESDYNYNLNIYNFNF